jgi:Acetyltransferase (GNAT) domain
MILHRFDSKDRRCEVGFWLVPEVRQRGVGTRSTSLAVSWAFENLDLLRVEMTTTPDNPVVPKLARRWALPTRARSANVQSSEVDASMSCGSASCVKSGRRKPPANASVPRGSRFARRAKACDRRAIVRPAV